MIKVEIKNLQNVVTHGASWNTMELAQAWIDQQVARGAWGKSAGYYNIESLTEAELLTEISRSVSELTGTISVEIPTQYTIEITEIVDPSIANEARKFLADTDWMIVRHIGQKALNIQTSLTEQEYLDLESERQIKRGLV